MNSKLLLFILCMLSLNIISAQSVIALPLEAGGTSSSENYTLIYAAQETGGITSSENYTFIQGFIGLFAGQNPTTSIYDNPLIDAFSVFPNPVLNELSVSFQSSLNGKIQINLISMNGNKVNSWSFEKNSEFFSEKLKITGLAPGSYVLIVKDNEKPLAVHTISKL